MEFQHFRVARHSAATAPRAAVNFVWGACVRGLSSSFRAANSRTTFLPIYLRPQTPDCGEIVLKSSRYARLAHYRQQQQHQQQKTTPEHMQRNSRKCVSRRRKNKQVDGRMSRRSSRKLQNHTSGSYPMKYQKRDATQSKASTVHLKMAAAEQANG